MLTQLWDAAQKYYQSWMEPVVVEIPRTLYAKVGSQMIEAKEPYSFGTHHTFYFFIPETERLMDYEYTVCVDSLKKELYRRTYRHCGTQAIVVPFSSDYLEFIPKGEDWITVRVTLHLQEKRSMTWTINK